MLVSVRLRTLLAYHVVPNQQSPDQRHDDNSEIQIFCSLIFYFIFVTGMACGEQAASPVIFKQLLKSGAISYCQIDAVRVAGVNDVMAIILMAAKYKIPVCPHGGGIALCNLIQVKFNPSTLALKPQPHP